MRYFGEFGDCISSHDMDFNWSDEQIHAHYGTRWLKYFLEKAGDPRKPIDFRDQSEACIHAIGASATPEDKQAVADTFEQTMARALNADPAIEIIDWPHRRWGPWASGSEAEFGRPPSR